MERAPSREIFYFFLNIKVAFFNQFLHIQPQTSHWPHVASSRQVFILFLTVATKTSQGIAQQWHEETFHKGFISNTMLSVPQMRAVISVQDK